MPRNRYGGVGIPESEDPPFDVELAVEADGDDEEVVEKVAMAAREAGVRALQAFAENTHPDECDGVPVSVNWDSVLESYHDDEADGGGE
jgi:hypothetical protein